MPLLLRLCVLLAFAAPAQARTVARVALPETTRVGGTTFVLNGASVYRKFGFKVLVAGLYLSHRETDAVAILGADAPRRYVTHFVRGVGAKKIRDAWRKGFARNDPGAPAGLKARFESLCGWIGDQKAGDEIVFTYRPGLGSTLEANGSKRGAVQGKDFADAYFGLAIGPKPIPGEAFKSGLLGR
jgi:hypothetical protein